MAIVNPVTLCSGIATENIIEDMAQHRAWARNCNAAGDGFGTNGFDTNGGTGTYSAGGYGAGWRRMGAARRTADGNWEPANNKAESP